LAPTGHELCSRATATAPSATPASSRRLSTHAPGSSRADRGGGKIEPTKLPTESIDTLTEAIKAIDKHFIIAEQPGTTKTVDMLGDDSKNKDIAVLVRGQLCTALSRVMLHGFKSFKLIGRWHIWDFVQESCDRRREAALGGDKVALTDDSTAEKSLLKAVDTVNSHEGMANNPNIKFRSFVCCGLNERALHDWVRVLTLDRETMQKFYETWAFVNSSPDALSKLMTTLQPLADHRYTLSLDYELNRWDLH